MATLQMRWRVADPKEERPVLEVKELYVWDLQTARRLLGVLRYQVTRGSETTLFIDVPSEWEVRRVFASLQNGGAGGLRDWGSVQGPQSSRLRLEFQTPLTTGVQVSFELLSRKPATTHAVLALPTPVAAASSGGMLGFHLGPRGASLTESLGFTGVDLKSFVTEWQSAGAGDPGLLGRAFSFRRSATASPTMHLDLKPLTRFTASSEVAWRVGPRELACEASLHLNGREEDLMVVEWDLPAGFQMVEVLGVDVHVWSITEKHVQVWLRPGVNKTDITWRAWAPNSRALGEASIIPVMHLAHAAELETNIRVEAEPGWTVLPGKLSNLHSLSAPLGTLAFATDQPQYSGEFILQEAPPNRSAKVVEKPPAPDERPPAKARSVYLTLEEQAALLGSDDEWEHRADYFFLAGFGQASICPPGSAQFTRAILDGQELSLGDTTCLLLQFEGPLKRRQLRICWRWPPGQERVDRPDLSKPRLENVSTLPGALPDDGLWEIVTTSATTVQATERAAVPVSPPTRFVRRAAADVSVARFLARAEKGLFREYEKQFQQNAEAASAWLAQAAALQERPEDTIDLEIRLRRLEVENRLVAQNFLGAETRLPAELPATHSVLDRPKGFVANRESTGRVSSGPGISSFWQAADKGGQPQLVVAPASQGELKSWLRWSLAVALGGVLLFLVSPWTLEARRRALRPEISALLGLLAGFLAGSWWLALSVLGLVMIWRLVLVVLIASAKSTPAEGGSIVEQAS